MSSSTKQSITTISAPNPVGPYSQAIRAGEWLYCSGQIAIDPSSNEMVGDGDVEQETHQVLKNLLAVLDAAGATTPNIIKTTIYLTDLNDFAKVNRIYAGLFEEVTPPARACIQAAALPKGAKVEIECIAWLEN